MATKLTSRKFWVSIIGQIVGIVSIVWGANIANDVSAIAGAIILIASTLGYLKAESDIDKARVSK